MTTQYAVQALERECIDALRSGNPAVVPTKGAELLGCPRLNKDTAFTDAERDLFELRGLLPTRVMTIEEQVAVELEKLHRKEDLLERFIGLAALQDRNETLFYRVLVENLEEFLPIVYTPVVGRACQEYSHILRRPRGLWLTPEDIDRIPALLRNASHEDVRLIVVTDNERILGLGDQGAGGMGIPVGKLALYTAGAGIYPALTLPVSLDVGTDNEKLLNDPMYVGYRKPRLRGPQYEEFVEAFVEGVIEVFPHALLQWEDFKQHNAIRLLDQYRHQITSFNDDIQGTAAIAVATILAALRASGRTLPDARIVLAGAGAAGTGIARLLQLAMVEDGMGADDARAAIAVLDSHGLVVEGRPGLDEDKWDAALPRDVVAAMGLDPSGTHGLREVVTAFRPSVHLGTTAVGGAFGEAAIRAMAAGAERPIVLPLSNPTANTEARPADLMAWTDGRAIIATGSPFPPLEIGGVSRRIPQANNGYIFPGVGLGAIVSEARILPESAFLVAARRLADMATPEMLARGALFPPISELRVVAREIAIAVVAHLGQLGVGRRFPPDAIPAAVSAAMWRPDYVPYEAV